MNNWIGFLTLTKREMTRFFKVPINTLVPQLVTILFYLLIFGIAVGTRIDQVAGVDYLLFILPGLFAQVLINGSFSNPSGSIYVGRRMGNINDVLMAPISNLQFITAIIIGGMSRGLVLAAGTIIIALFFTTLQIHSWPILIAYILLISFLFSCLGIVNGLWADGWEDSNIFLNFILTPLVFLGGVFYTLEMVPRTMEIITLLNPVFYMVNGARYGMLGIQDAPVFTGLLVLTFVCVIAFLGVYYLIRTGYKLRE